jgi:hypothetical protein
MSTKTHFTPEIFKISTCDKTAYITKYTDMHLHVKLGKSELDQLCQSLYCSCGILLCYKMLPSGELGCWVYSISLYYFLELHVNLQ